MIEAWQYSRDCFLRDSDTSFIQGPSQSKIVQLLSGKRHQICHLASDGIIGGFPISLLLQFLAVG